jgi:hypothetical protein
MRDERERVERGRGTVIVIARNEKQEREERIQHGIITIKCEK